MLHEVAGGIRSWDPQVEQLRDRFTCIRYNARGFPPSSVPESPAAYSQSIAVDDALDVLDALGIGSAHFLGFSMGGFCTLHTCLRTPERVQSAVVVGAGYGSNPEHGQTFLAEMESAGRRFREDPHSAAISYANGPARLQLRAKAPQRWERFRDALAGHSPIGQAYTFTEVLGKRPSLFSLRDELARLEMPVLLVVGDEDDGCLETNLMLKRTIPASGLAVLPRTGHTPNLEDPGEFNRQLLDFLQRAQRGEWTARDPQSLDRGLVGM
ncbi:alpha/beta fold hydrolase [Phytoactinopolyspora alkaliphila]|uniref:Alpha/beta fold hydrolase n=2 Tax=Phytoactinopolyspora alkaliphila TaxID=1783498 RepID=A0A6N9YJT4_9ACTN|nr:alpha/beta hydrolase [Phytoactinopolyspora alkaliphila]NED95224.1 alpha/beta fold hydrolase [Phytoactinopolyspora alkaliphila]